MFCWRTPYSVRNVFVVLSHTSRHFSPRNVFFNSILVHFVWVVLFLLRLRSNAEGLKHWISMVLAKDNDPDKRIGLDHIGLDSEIWYGTVHPVICSLRKNRLIWTKLRIERFLDTLNFFLDLILKYENSSGYHLNLFFVFSSNKIAKSVQ